MLDLFKLLVEKIEISIRGKEWARTGILPTTALGNNLAFTITGNSSTENIPHGVFIDTENDQHVICVFEKEFQPSKTFMGVWVVPFIGNKEQTGSVLVPFNSDLTNVASWNDESSVKVVSFRDSSSDLSHKNFQIEIRGNNLTLPSNSHIRLYPCEYSLKFNY